MYGGYLLLLLRVGAVQGLCEVQHRSPLHGLPWSFTIEADHMTWHGLPTCWTWHGVNISYKHVICLSMSWTWHVPTPQGPCCGPHHVQGVVPLCAPFHASATVMHENKPSPCISQECTISGNISYIYIYLFTCIYIYNIYKNKYQSSNNISIIWVYINTSKHCTPWGSRLMPDTFWWHPVSFHIHSCSRSLRWAHLGQA